LAFEFGSPDQVLWSPVGFDGWQLGIVPWLSSMFIPADFEFSGQLFELPVPCNLPNLAKSGTYTLLIGAFEPGGFDAICDISSSTFGVTGGPFITLTPSEIELTWGDTLTIDLSVDTPGYGLQCDIYLVILDPDGGFWSPDSLGGAWTGGIAPLLSEFVLPPDVEMTLDDLWQISLPAAPFDKAGHYTLFAAPTETGTLSPLCDIGIGTLSLE
ncbi:MAG: hypothetical protein JW941_05430, partial [Candidatus Coatesbacteria bacterium]|nr:hypothetical protein [Candidatus Coatesbacteria bacterium]